MGAGSREGGRGANPGCTLMTSPPSTFISFWRFPESRLGLERHFSSPSRFTGQEESGISIDHSLSDPNVTSSQLPRPILAAQEQPGPCQEQPGPPQPLTQRLLSAEIP